MSPADDAPRPQPAPPPPAVPPPVPPTPETVEDLEAEDGAERQRFVLGRDAKFRLDRFLQSKIGGFSRHQIQKLIAMGAVTVNGRKAKASQKLKEADVLEVVVPPRPADHLLAEPIPLHILHEEPGFIVVNKQANLIVHPARSYRSGTLLNGLAHHFRAENESLSSVGEDAARPGVIHRLDKDTTGVMVVGKQDEPHWKIAKQFEHRTALKAYLAVCHGCPDPPGGAIDQPLGKHPTIREAMAVRHDSQGRRSVTLYRVRERYAGYSLVELELKTGRTHQIRVHLSYLGHPLVGDILYGGMPVGDAELDTPPQHPARMPHVTYARAKVDGQRIDAEAAAREAGGGWMMRTPALHAALLRLAHPDTGEPITFTAALHEPMATLVRKLRNRPAGGEVVTAGTHVDLDAAVPTG